MNIKQEQALDSLLETREWLKYQAFAMASLNYISVDENQQALLTELHENYECEDETGKTIRAICKDAFGSYPFERIDWNIFEDWDTFMTEDEQVDFLYEQHLVDDMDDFNVEDVGHIKWLDYCFSKAKERLEQIIRQIDSFIAEHAPAQMGVE